MILLPNHPHLSSMDRLLQQTFMRYERNDHTPPSLPVSKVSSSRLRHIPAQSIMAWGSIKRSFSSLKPDEKFETHVEKIAAGLRPSDEHFPWDRLSDYSSSCIKKQRNIDVHHGIDDYLVSLIRSCPIKDAAIAACANLLSQHVVKDLLSELKPERGSIQGLQYYIQILLAVNHYHLQIVDNAEATRGRTVLHLLSRPSNDPVSLMQPLASLIEQGVPRSSYLSDYLEALARQSCSMLSTRMETFRANADWYYAHKEAPWLVEFLVKKFGCGLNDLSIIDIMDESFPTWQSWAVWKPSQETLDAYHVHLSTRQRDRVLIRDLLALEGPDFSVGKRLYVTRKDEISYTNGPTLVLRCGTIEFDLFGTRPNHVRATLEELTKLLVQVCVKDTVIDNSRMMLLQQICLGAPINEKRLSLLEAAYDSGSSVVITAVTEIKVAEREGREPDSEMLTIIFQALEWERSEELRRLLGASVVASVCKHLEKMQRVLKMIINVDRSWNLPDLHHLEALQSFGETCGKAPRLKDSFPETSQSLLQVWPAKWEVSFDIGQFAH
jgi:hypothetical protein